MINIELFVLDSCAWKKLTVCNKTICVKNSWYSLSIQKEALVFEILDSV